MLPQGCSGALSKTQKLLTLVKFGQTHRWRFSSVPRMILDTRNLPDVRMKVILYFDLKSLNGSLGKLGLIKKNMVMHLGFAG